MKPLILLGLLILAFVIGIISGAYPAFYLAKLKPVSLINSLNKTKKFNFGIKQLIVVIQFALSTFLIIATIFANRQLNHLQNAPLGFDNENIIMLPTKE